MTPVEQARKAAVQAAAWMDGTGGPGWIAGVALDAFLAKLAEDGMVLVPRVATEKMCSTYDAHVWLIDPDEFKPQLAGRVWSAMIAATSPPPPEGKGDGT